MEIIVLLILLFLVYILWDNLRISIRKVEIIATEDGSNHKIVHISDFHCRIWGKNNSYLVNKIKRINPEYILISGDLLDRRIDSIVAAERLLEDLNKIVKSTIDNPKIIYVYGNHEKDKSDEYLDEYEKMLKSKKVLLLKDEVYSFELNGKQVNIIGLDDNIRELEINILSKRESNSISLFESIGRNSEYNKENLKMIAEKLSNIFRKNENKLKNGYNILISHRPEAFKEYSKHNINLVLTGHAHGGQVRIPFINMALVAPHQGFLPKYTSGPYKENNTLMYVNRGLGNSTIPVRIFNASEFIEIDFKI